MELKTYPIFVITIVFVLLASACSPAQTPTAAPTMSISPTAVQTLPEFSTGDLDQGGEELPTGKYQTPAWFDLPFEFKTTEPYRGGGRSSEFGQIFALVRGENSLGNATHRLVFFAFPTDVSGIDSTQQLRGTSLLDSGAIQILTLPNMTGTQWDADAAPNPAQKSENDVVDGTIPIPALYGQMRFEGTWHTATPEAQLRFIMPDITGRTVLIYLEAPQAEFDVWASEAEQLLKTINFIERTEAAAEPTSVPESNTIGEIWGEPAGVLAVDAQGNVYVLREDLIIYKYDPDGNLLTQWGGPGSEDGQFNNQVGTYYGIDLDVDAQGNVYVADFGNFRVQKFDSNGQFLKKWGSQGEEPGQFTRPWTLSVDSTGNTYVGDEAMSRIQKFDSEGNFLLQWGKSGSKEDEFLSIITIGVDHEDNLYVSDFFQQQVKKFDSNGNLLTTWNTCSADPEGAKIRPVAFAFDEQNNVYLMDSVLAQICIYNSDGRFLKSWGGHGKGIGKFIFYEGVADLVIDSQGNLYVADGDSDYGNNRIQKFRKEELSRN